MLRLLKRYKFGYHLSGIRHSPRTPTGSIFMSSYPGALSSHDEYYVVRGGKDNDDILILAAIPLRDSPGIPSAAWEDQGESEGSEEEEESISNNEGLLSPVRIMAANRLATEARSWSRILARSNHPSKLGKGTSKSLQWITLRPKNSAVWLVEQYSSRIYAIDYTEKFEKNGFVFSDGEPIFNETVFGEKLENEVLGSDDSIGGHESPASTEVHRFFVENITSVESIRNLMRGTAKYFDQDAPEDRVNSSASDSFETNESRLRFGLDPLGKFIFRADLEKPPKPLGIIDNKMALVTADGFESFEATSGPPHGHELAGALTKPFDWSESFANVSRIGQPTAFNFESVTPEWIWF